jgi:hypothetical protein
VFWLLVCVSLLTKPGNKQLYRTYSRLRQHGEWLCLFAYSTSPEDSVHVGAARSILSSRFGAPKIPANLTCFYLPSVSPFEQRDR